MISIPSAIAALLYLITCAACLLAATSGRLDKQAKRISRTYLAAGGLFIGMAVTRLLDGENVMRSILREWLRNRGLFAERGELQIVLVALLIAGGSVIGAVVSRRLIRASHQSPDFLCALTQLACIAFLFLFALRIVSLHAIDQLIYSGPIRLNWIADVGLTLSVLMASLIQWRMRRRQSGGSGRR